MGDERAPAISPLSRTFTRDGWTLEIEIYEDGDGKWLLEVLDERNTSTVWTEPFDTEPVGTRRGSASNGRGRHCRLQ